MESKRWLKSLVQWRHSVKGLEIFFHIFFAYVILMWIAYTPWEILLIRPSNVGILRNDPILPSVCLSVPVGRAHKTERKLAEQCGSGGNIPPPRTCNTTHCHHHHQIFYYGAPQPVLRSASQQFWSDVDTRYETKLTTYKKKTAGNSILCIISVLCIIFEKI